MESATETISTHRLVEPIETMMTGSMLDGSSAILEVICIVLNNSTDETYKKNQIRSHIETVIDFLHKNLTCLKHMNTL